jgi:hypothetical protein
MAWGLKTKEKYERGIGMGKSAKRNSPTQKGFELAPVSED